MGLGSSSGQVLVEFTVCFCLAIGVISGGIHLLVTHWHRSQCAFYVFESVHAVLLGKHPPRGPYLVQIFERLHEVEGVGECGGSTERVVLPRLEWARWE